MKSIDEVSRALAELMRPAAGAVEIAGAEALRAPAPGPCATVFLHRVSIDLAARSSPVARNVGPVETRVPARLGYAVLMRGADAEAEQRALTVVLASILAGPVLSDDPLWTLTIESPEASAIAAWFAAVGVALRPAIWCEARGLLG